MSKLLSNLSEIIIICDSLRTTWVIKSVAINSFSQFFAWDGGPTNSLSFHMAPWDADRHPEIQGGFLEWEGSARGYLLSQPLGAAAGESSLGPAARFLIENSKNPRICPQIIKYFCRKVNNCYKTKKKRKKEGCVLTLGLRVPWKALARHGVSWKQHYQMIYVCNSSFIWEMMLKFSLAPSAVQNRVVVGLSLMSQVPRVGLWGFFWWWYLLQ